MTENSISKSGRKVFGCFGLAFGSLFLVVGIGLMVSITLRGFAQRSTSSWTKTQGEIVNVNTEFNEDRDRASPITYKYDIDGNVYRSNTVVFVDAQNLEYEAWLGLGDGIPENGNVDVFYNPNDRSESVLRTGDATESWNGFWFGGLFAGFAAIWMTAWWGMSNWLPDKLESLKSANGE